MDFFVVLYPDEDWGHFKWISYWPGAGDDWNCSLSTSLDINRGLGSCTLINC